MCLVFSLFNDEDRCEGEQEDKLDDTYEHQCLAQELGCFWVAANRLDGAAADEADTDGRADEAAADHEAFTDNLGVDSFCCEVNQFHL